MERHSKIVSSCNLKQNEKLVKSNNMNEKIWLNDKRAQPSQIEK